MKDNKSENRGLTIFLKILNGIAIAVLVLLMIGLFVELNGYRRSKLDYYDQSTLEWRAEQGGYGDLMYEAFYNDPFALTEFHDNPPYEILGVYVQAATKEAAYRSVGRDIAADAYGSIAESAKNYLAGFEEYVRQIDERIYNLLEVSGEPNV